MAGIIAHSVMFPGLPAHVSILYGFIFTKSAHDILGTVRKENEHQTGEMKEGNMPTTFE